MIGKLNLVDLAGSERIKSTGTDSSGKRLDETKKINASLSAFGKVGYFEGMERRDSPSLSQPSPPSFPRSFWLSRLPVTTTFRTVTASSRAFCKAALAATARPP